MTRRHRKILAKASETKRYFDADGADARVAWELLNADLIEGETMSDQEGVPIKVVVMGITVEGREKLDSRSRHFWGWILGVLAVAVGTVIGAIINYYLGLNGNGAVK